MAAMSLRRAAALALASATLATACGRPAAPPPPPRARPNILLVTIDTLRADRVGRGLTPVLDGIAAGGVRFTHARATVPLTLPSHATILSGLLPTRHGVRLNGTGHFTGHPTLATILKARGYRTAAAVGAFVLNRQFGLGDGFDAYDNRVQRDPNASTALEAERPAAAVTDAALAALPAGAGAPWFLWVHYYDPHAPYTPPSAWSAGVAQSSSFAGGRSPGVAQSSSFASETPAYDGEVAYVDSELGRLLAALRARSTADTLVVVCGDHGESLGEHGEGTHGMLLYDGALRVPLIVAVLGHGEAEASPYAHRTSPGVRQENVSLVDVAPTILAFLAIQPPAAMDGIDLLGPVKPDRELYAETQYPAAAGWSPLSALVSAPWKAIAGGRTQLFDVASDPAETTDVAPARAAVASGMEARIRTLSASAKASTAPLTGDARERLRALGYVAPSPSMAAPGSAPDPADRIAEWRALRIGVGGPGWRPPCSCARALEGSRLAKPCRAGVPHGLRPRAGGKWPARRGAPGVPRGRRPLARRRRAASRPRRGGARRGPG